LTTPFFASILHRDALDFFSEIDYDEFQERKHRSVAVAVWRRPPHRAVFFVSPRGRKAAGGPRMFGVRAARLSACRLRLRLWYNKF